jgi:hypothetical protein
MDIVEGFSVKPQEEPREVFLLVRRRGKATLRASAHTILLCTRRILSAVRVLIIAFSMVTRGFKRLSTNDLFGSTNSQDVVPELG